MNEIRLRGTRFRRMPSIKLLMTPFPYSIESGAELERARRMMAEHDFHHLPVVDGDEPVGVISARDLELAARRSRPITVGEVAEEAFVVDLNTPADLVLESMAERHLGAAVVVKEDRLAGIFTPTDATSLFADFLRSVFPPRGGGEVA